MDFVTVQIVGDVTRFVTEFAGIAGNGPISAILLLFGGIFVLFSGGLFGVLTAGAILSALSDAVSGFGRSPPPGAK
jgi:hypothetical protein